jgi:hypothetical protein
VTALVNDVYATAYQMETAYATAKAANTAATAGYNYLRSRIELSYELILQSKGEAEAAAAAFALVPSVSEKIDEVTGAVATASGASSYSQYVAAQPVEVPENKEVKPAEVAIESAKYVIDNNQIVYMTYENGTALLLNYNSYAVLVEINGTTYSVAAYGYKVIR